ncbi:MAG TPA: M20 family metallopeptidase [Acidimicrobiales bacterium]|nr:M20 family metallopeptidase [Acidimicrobiales bacterium]
MHAVAGAGEMLDELERLVSVESPSLDHEACARCADALTEVASVVLPGHAPERIVVDGATHLRWRFGPAPTRVVVIGHLDTVWPLGTLDELPFSVVDGVARGPGSFDMKAGLVLGLHALGALDDLDGVTLLVNSDEEIGSVSSRALVEDTARGAQAALVLEPAVDGALKTARKGVGLYRFDVAGRSAHAGLEPEKGANALLALAAALGSIAALGDSALGTTVTPTTASAGSARNVVPDHASSEIDLRGETIAELERVDAAIRSLRPTLDGTTFTVGGGINRPPLAEAASRDLLALAARVAQDLGLPALRGQAVGGGSDGNFTAGIGVPTLDGLGAVGGGAHARTEHVIVDSMPERAALVAGLLRRILSP